MKILVIILGLFLVSCSVSNREGVDSLTRSPQAQAEEGRNLEVSQENKVWVYKYDGGLQCGMGEEISLEKMRVDLEGIKVFRQEKRSDGMMRIQVCGSPAGRANLYEISKKDVEEAKEKGFKLWTFN
jgi:hypothetical protein